MCHLQFLATLRTAALLPAEAKALVDGKGMVVEMTAETESAVRACNNQPKRGSDSRRNGGRGGSNSGSLGSRRDGGIVCNGNVGANSFGNDGGRQRWGQTTIN
jgi:hypothetical protein